MVYRRGVDGLRAIAVLPVILFHSGVPGFSGGFVGVDIFFVISGYLITRLIVADLDHGTFSIVTFYERRARRILPALFTVVAASAFVAYLYMLPSDLVSFSRSAIATVMFVSNFWFWSETGYFDVQASLKPLLHTWSLAVEEQFYVFFPILLIVFRRVLKTVPLTYVVAPIAVASFGFSIWQTSHQPEAAFFLPPSRVWELLLGALLSLGVAARPFPRVVTECAAAAGLGMIAFSIWWLSEQSSFPGLNAVPACLGAAFVLWADGRNSFIVTRLLGARLPVAAGKISYSLYLWHWPTLVFAHYIAGPDLAPIEIFFLLTAVFCASYATWRFVETPFRQSVSFKGWPLATATLLMSSAAAGCALFAIAGQGLPWRLNDQTTRLLAEARGADKIGCAAEDALHPQLPCVRGTPGVAPSFVLAGDSHANALSAGVFAAAKRLNVSGYQYTIDGLRLLPGVIQVGAAQRAEKTSEFMSFLRAHPEVKLVVLAGFWQLQATGKSWRHHDVLFIDADYDGSGASYNKESFARGLTRLIQAFPDRTFVILGDVPTGRRLDINAAARMSHVHGEGFELESTLRIPRKDYDGALASYSPIIEKALSHGFGFSVPLGNTFCNAQSCSGVQDGRLLYHDGDHLSERGALLLTSRLEKALSQGLAMSRTASIR